MTQDELARVARLTTMGELAASIAHEVNQPLTAVANNVNACLRLQTRDCGKYREGSSQPGNGEDERAIFCRSGKNDRET